MPLLVIYTLFSLFQQYKQEAKNAQDVIQDYTKLQNDHEKILKQVCLKYILCGM